MPVDLMSVLPEYFRPVREFKELMAVHGAALEKAEGQIRKISANCFVQTADTKALASYEALFGLVYKPGETMEYRRQRILQKFNTVAPFSDGFLRARLTELFGDEYSVDIDARKCVLKVIVTSSRYGAVDLLYGLIWDVAPVHLQIIANHQVTNQVPGNLYSGAVASTTYIQTI